MEAYMKLQICKFGPIFWVRVVQSCSPNELFTSKMTKYTFVGSVSVSNVKGNKPGEKWKPKLSLRYEGT